MNKSLSDFVDEALENVSEISPEEVAKLLGSKEFMIIDVREKEEFEEGHLPGSVLYPRGVLEVKADLEHFKRDPKLEDRSQKIICYCGGGHRSALAADALRKMGFENPLSMAEGWRGWIKRDLPIEH